jgi:uncharacterized protein (DUF849 family)
VLGKRGLKQSWACVAEGVCEQPRMPAEHPALPATASDLAREVAATVTAGAGAA